MTSESEGDSFKQKMNILFTCMRICKEKDMTGFSDTEILDLFQTNE